MSTDRHAPAASRHRTPTRHELTRFYRAIGIPAVVSAAQAAKMTAPQSRPEAMLPAFLRDAHSVG
jgi:hypothetical protein